MSFVSPRPSIGSLSSHTAINLKEKFEKLSVMIHVLQTTQNLVISRFVLSRTVKKCTKNYNARTQPLFCSLSLLFPLRYRCRRSFFRPRLHVSGYFCNFFSLDSKISPSTRSVFKSNSPVHTHPMVSGFTLVPKAPLH